MSDRHDVSEYAHACWITEAEKAKEKVRGEEGRREEERRERTDKAMERGREREGRREKAACLEDEIPPRQNSIRGKGAIRISHIGARALIRIESNRG